MKLGTCKTDRPPFQLGSKVSALIHSGAPRSRPQSSTHIDVSLLTRALVKSICTQRNTMCHCSYKAIKPNMCTVDVFVDNLLIPKLLIDWLTKRQYSVDHCKVNLISIQTRTSKRVIRYGKLR